MFVPAATFLSRIHVLPAAVTPSGVVDIWLNGQSSDDETLFPLLTGPDVSANGGTDVFVAKVRVSDDPWTDVGSALAGTHGAPLLTATGSLQPLTTVTWTLSNALENSTTFLVLGFVDVSVPFKGGVLVPDPAPPGQIIALPTGPLGEVPVAFTWPGGPSGFDLWVHHWIVDPAGPVGFAASNAVKGTVPWARGQARRNRRRRGMTRNEIAQRGHGDFVLELAASLASRASIRPFPAGHFRL